MNAKIGVVILNYMNYRDTAECVESILNQTYPNYEIIIVDNGSTNQSYEVLKFLFSDNPLVSLIKNERNMGFAKGNNLGIRYAREVCKADYVFVCNSDILVQEDLFDRILSYDAPGIGVISPTVCQTDGKLQPYTISTDHIYQKIVQTIRDILLVWMSYLPVLHHLSSKRNRSVLPSEQPQGRIRRKKYRYMLQGCSYFLTPQFFQYYKQLYPKTFLYWEEINLLVYLKKVNLVSVIADTSPVIHKDQGSARILFRNQSISKKKLQFSTISMLKSLPMFFMKYETIKTKYN